MIATVLVAVLVSLLAISLPIEKLAEWTSVATLVVFALVNLALIRLQRSAAPARGFAAPRWVPYLGLAACLLLLATALL
ncbi:MAG: hypothetical protein WD207_02745 [Xanthobacteraceae bacterium]